MNIFLTQRVVHRKADDLIGNLIGNRQVFLLCAWEILVGIEVRNEGILSPARGSGFHQGALFSFVDDNDTFFYFIADNNLSALWIYNILKYKPI